MKAQAFLELVGKMMAAQQDYFAAKRNGDPKAKELLFRSKGIEKAVMNVVKEGRLEPDFMATLESTDGPAAPGLFDEICAPFEKAALDLLEEQHPTDDQGDIQHETDETTGK